MQLSGCTWTSEEPNLRWWAGRDSNPHLNPQGLPDDSRLRAYGPRLCQAKYRIAISVSRYDIRIS